MVRMIWKYVDFDGKRLKSLSHIVLIGELFY